MNYFLYALYAILIAPLAGMAIGALVILFAALLYDDISNGEYLMFMIFDLAVPFGGMTGFVFGILSLPILSRVTVWKLLLYTGVGTVFWSMLGTVILSLGGGFLLGMFGYWFGAVQAYLSARPGKTQETTP